MQEKTIRQYWILVRRDEEGLRQCSALVNRQMGISSGERWRTQEKVSILLESGTIKPALQDNVLLPGSLTEHIFHVVNGKQLRSIENHGLIPGGVSLKTGRQAVFFTTVNPMDYQDGSGKPYETCHKQESRHTNTWKHFQDTVFWCNLKLAQQRGLQFYQTRSNAVIFYDTLPAEFIEKAMCMETKDLLYQRESVILRPRVVLEANSQSGSQDLREQEARSS